MHSNAAERPIAVRTQAAVLAFLVQVLFISALWFAAVRQTERTSARETALFLAPPPLPGPRTIDARGGAPEGPAPSRAAPIPFLPVPFFPVPQPVPQADLRAFGGALFGCAPEHYADLPPEERAHCPKPGEGLAANPPPDLLNGDRSYVKNNARWANALAHEQSQLLLPGGFEFPLALLGAVLDGSVADPTSAFRDPEKWPVYESGPTPPREGERSRDAAHLDPSRIDRQAPGRH